jgi:hypothetical protein
MLHKTGDCFANNDEKIEELILFVATRSENDPFFGATKLNKILFFAEFLAYAKFGKAITGHAYMRLSKGPVLKAMMPVQNRMVENKLLAVRERDHFGKTQKRVVPLRDANLKVFSSEEIAVVTEVIDALRKNNAKGVSSLSHKFGGWKLAQDKETIPYEMALVEFKKPRKKDVAKALANRVELSALRRESRNHPNAGEH